MAPRDRGVSAPGGQCPLTALPPRIPCIYFHTRHGLQRLSVLPTQQHFLSGDYVPRMVPDPGMAQQGPCGSVSLQRALKRDTHRSQPRVVLARTRHPRCMC